VVLLEEHLAIGLPKHCSGWLLGCEFTDELFPQLKYAMPHKRVSRMVVREPFSGQVKEDIENTGWGGYLIRRDLFERELARLAVASGAKLLLNVKVEDLLREDGLVVGVKTTSSRLPEVRATVTICADGKNSATTRGFARREIAPAAEAETCAGVIMELVQVKGVKPGVIEIYEPEDPSFKRHSFWPHAGVTVTPLLFP
jgi:flavin-dependent dehydrogenase